MNGEYEFLSELGEGAFGEVVLARRLQGAPSGGMAGELVCIKCFSRSRLSKRRDIRQEDGRLVVTTALDKITGELLALHLVNRRPCPNILRLRALYSSPHSDTFYFVFNFIDGGTLMQYSEAEECFRSRVTGGPLSLRVVRQLLRGLARALHHCHSLGCAHRDIKPDNILVTSQGKLVLCDFGVAGIYKPRLFGWAKVRALLPSIFKYSRQAAAAGSGGGGGGGGGGGSSSSSSSSSISSSNSSGGASGTGERPVVGSASTIDFLNAISASVTPLGFKAPPLGLLPRDTVRDTAGTILFICPEAAEGKPYSAFAADLWAVGVVMYITLFGVVPFGRGLKDPLAVFSAISAAMLPETLPWNTAFLSSGGAEAPPPSSAAALRGTARAAHDDKAAAEDLLRRLLCLDPSRRISSVGALLAHPFLAYSTAGGTGVGGSAGKRRDDAEELMEETFPAVDLRTLPLFITPEMALDAGAVHSSEEGVAGGAGSMSGWLLKRCGQGLFGKQWKRYFFILEDSGLMSYFSAPPLAPNSPLATEGAPGEPTRAGSISAPYAALQRRRSSAAAAQQGGGAGGGRRKQSSFSSSLSGGSSESFSYGISGGGEGRDAASSSRPSSSPASPVVRGMVGGEIPGGGAAPSAAATAAFAAAAAAASECSAEESKAQLLKGFFSLKEGGEGMGRFRLVSKPDKPYRFFVSTPLNEVFLQAESKDALAAWEAALRIHCLA